jgi:hypothetical protein
LYVTDLPLPVETDAIYSRNSKNPESGEEDFGDVNERYDLYWVDNEQSSFKKRDLAEIFYLLLR